jgi:hypothetical protein
MDPMYCYDQKEQQSSLETETEISMERIRGRWNEHPVWIPGIMSPLGTPLRRPTTGEKENTEQTKQRPWSRLDEPSHFDAELNFRGAMR